MSGHAGKIVPVAGIRKNLRGPVPGPSFTRGHTGAFYLLLALFLAVFFTGCQRPLPERNPDSYAPAAPGKFYRMKEEPGERPVLLEKEEKPPETLKPAFEAFSLAELVDVALRMNPSTRRAWDLARAAAAQWAVSRGDYYPTITGDASAMGMGGDTSHGYYGQVGISLSYLLLDFGGREAAVESARQALTAANWNHNQVIQDVLRDVPQAYYTYLGNRARVRASEASLKEALTSLESTEHRKKAGVSTIADVLQARSKADQAKLDLIGNRGALKISKGNLATAIGWHANANFEVKEDPGNIPLDTVRQNTEELIQLALRDRPDLASSKASVRQSEAELRKSEAELWPKLTATGNVGWSGINGDLGDSEWLSGGGRISSSDVSYYGGLTLQIPLFEGFSLRNKVRQARASLDAARDELRMKEETVISEVWSAFYTVRTAAQQVETSETLVASSEQSYNVSLARYQAGAADIVELLNAQSTLASARSQRVQARTDLFTSYAELIHAIGADLPAETQRETSLSN